MQNVADIITNQRYNKDNASIVIDNAHNYVFVVGATFRRAFKVTSTDNNGTIILSFPMSWARCKMVKGVSVYANGNVTVKGKGARASANALDEAINSWLEGVA